MVNKGMNVWWVGGWMEKWVGREVTPVQPKASLRTEALSGEAATVKSQK